MNKIIEIETKKIENMIYEIRGKQVMLDSDLAKLYVVETKRINEAVKNNIEKFPERFSFRLSDEESKKLLVEIFDQKNETRGGRYKNPRVFTEQGVAMLATILKSKVATEVSIKIMDAFVEMRKYIATNNYDRRITNLETRMIDTETKVDKIFNKFDKKIDNHIFFEGQIYDAYSLLVDILNEASESVILIDNYIDKQILDIVSLLNIKVTIITSDYNKHDIEKYKEQYDNIEIIHSKKFHDRFIIIDYKILYHSGASFKDLGKKCFAINRIEEIKFLNQLLKNIYS